MRIGIFGGTFNPIHQGHLHIASEVMAQLALDRVVFIPSRHPPHKEETGLVGGEDRLEMVRLAIAPYPRFGVSTVELDREGPSYSVDTVKILREEWGPEAEIFFLLGTDAFLDVMTWRRPEELFRLCHFVVVSRPGTPFSALKPLPFFREVPPADLEALDQGRLPSMTLPLTERTSLYLRKVVPSPISATHLRKSISKKKDLDNLLPRAVESYILKKKLYIRR
jgi:nicotinate-nucleotide adenylyltransferase